MPDENPFWDFSVKLYGRGGVAPACLRLQDRCGADVNVFMYCCWAAHHHGALFDADSIDRILSIVAPWKTTVVEPLRQIRRALKTATHQGIGPNAQERLRTEIKRVELRSERLQQDALFAVSPSIGGSSVPAEERKRRAQQNVDHYLATLEANVDDAARNDAALVVKAAFESSESC